MATKTASVGKRHLSAVLVALLCILTVFVMIFDLSQRQKILEKNFSVVAGRIDLVLNDLGSALPSKTFNKDRFCGRYSVKFSEGNLYCLVGFSLQNPEGLNTEEANVVRKILEEKGGFKPAHELDSIRFYEGVKPSCRLDTPSVNVASELVELSFSCRANSPKSFYPYRGH